jgi:16S rRNA U516 pseudouridylate synthase RsuA-like enzyme
MRASPAAGTGLPPEPESAQAASGPGGRGPSESTLRQMVAAGVEAHGQSYRFVRAGLAYQESAAERAARGGSAARRASRSPPTAGALRGAAPRALAPGQRRGLTGASRAWVRVALSEGKNREVHLLPPYRPP